MQEYKNFKIIIAGAGGIGRAAGLLLAEYADFNVTLYLGDRDFTTATEAVHWIRNGNTRAVHAEAFRLVPGYEDTTGNVFEDADIVLDCLPGSEAPRIGAIARRYQLHYVNLTEYVSETEQLKQLAKGAPTGFILQAGLAPGFVNILANSLYRGFVSNFRNDKVEYIGMKVGALTENAEAPHFYGFTWSPVGVATEYLKDAWIIDNFGKKNVPSLSELRPIIISGTKYEENYTSGGAADLPDAFEGLARKLDYKTLRYPGHFNWVKKVLETAPEGTDPVNYLESRMRATIPLIENDMVIVYATVKGFDQYNQLRSVEKAFKIGPTKVGNVTLRAIQSTTAAPMAECARMLLTGKYKGAILQSQINPSEFMNGPFIREVYFSEGNNNTASAGAKVTVAA